jgi:hypothetical protein
MNDIPATSAIVIAGAPPTKTFVCRGMGCATPPW